MEVEDVHCVRSQLAERLQSVLLEAAGTVHSGFVRIHFRRECEPAIFPLRIARPGFLLSAYIGSGRVNLVVALRLEIIEMFVELIEISYARAGRCIGTCGIWMSCASRRARSR